MNVLKTMEFLKDFMRIKGCLTNKSDLWKTPKDIYNYYKKQNFFDPCPENPKFDGLTISWKEFNFVNPPYSEIEKRIDKALIEQTKGNKTIMLIPARTDTKWFRKLIEANCRITFIEGRLHFNDEGPAPFPSMFVKFSNENCKKYNFYYLTKEMKKEIYSNEQYK